MMARPVIVICALFFANSVKAEYFCNTLDVETMDEIIEGPGKIIVFCSEDLLYSILFKY